MATKNKPILTYNELVILIEKCSPKVKGKLTLENITWFVAYQMALELEDFGTKDLAREINNGGLVCKTEQDVVDWLEENELLAGELIQVLMLFGYTPEYEIEQR